MRQPFVAAQPATVQTRVWLPEHQWLHSVFSSDQNRVPTFRFVDLFSACVSLALSEPDAHARLHHFLVTELVSRDLKSPRRTCHVWQRQFDTLLKAYRAPWNSHPNPRFDLDAIATGCVAMVRSGATPVARTLSQARSLTEARLNLSPRATPERNVS